MHPRKLKLFNFLPCIPECFPPGNFTHRQISPGLFNLLTEKCISVCVYKFHAVRGQQTNQNHMLKHHTKYNMYYSYPLANLIFPRNNKYTVNLQVLYKTLSHKYLINIVKHAQSFFFFT